MNDYHKIDISSAFDAEKTAELDQMVEKLAAFPPDANKDAREIFKHWVLDAQLEQCARTNDFQRAEELVQQITPQGLTECLMQAAARGHVDVLRVFAEHTKECLNRVHALEAAAYFGHKECVELMTPYCLTSADRWMVSKGVDAAIDGKHFDVAHVMMPHIDVTRFHSAALRCALRDEKYEIAELFYPYSNIKSMLRYMRSEEDEEDVQHAKNWIEEYESKKMAQTLHANLNQTVTQTARSVKKI